MKRLLLATALAFSLPALGLAEQPLSDEQATEVIEAYWKSALFHLPLGTFDVSREGSDGPRGGIPEAALQRWYQPLQKAGVITITDDPDTVGRVSVTVTAKGQKRNLSKDPDMLAIPQGVPKIDKVVGNEPRRKGEHDYRIVRVRYTVDWDDAVASVLSYCGNPVTSEQKSIVLLRYDGPNAWKVVTEDDANAADDFCTQRVSDALQ